MFTELKLEMGIWTVEKEVAEKEYVATWVHPVKDVLKAV